MSSIFTPLLETMSATARTAWPFIQRAAAIGGLSGEQIITMLDGAGLTFRRQDMLALIREATGAELLKSDIARWPKDVLLPITRVRESVTKIVAPFSYTLRVSAVDINTGEEITTLRQAHSSQLLPFSEVTSQFLENAVSADQYQSLDIGEAEVIDVQRSGAAGVL